jgi:hypothetical protein
MNIGSRSLENSSSGNSSSGVLLQWPISTEYTSYRTGDEGWRNQNGYFNYTRPASPEVLAELDYSIGANYFWQLKTALTVGGVTSKTRFVDVNGIQAWGAPNNVNAIGIDKLTGIGYYRQTIASGVDWNGHIDNALAFSVTVQSIVYDTFYCISLQEFVLMFGNPNFGTANTDPITGNRIIVNGGAGYVFGSTTPGNSINCHFSENYEYISILSKGNTSKGTIYIFDARSLITV